jgi:hypothetical protein
MATGNWAGSQRSAHCKRGSLSILNPRSPPPKTRSRVSFAESLCPSLKGFLLAWGKLFGLGLQADSSAWAKDAQKT